MRPEPELHMIARPSQIPEKTAPSTGSLSAETPLQRQILLWQHELLRRAELRRAVGSEPSSMDLGGTNLEADPAE
jgi:hypothetical protein